MMSLWDALRMNMMISYQELVRTFLSSGINQHRLMFLVLCEFTVCSLIRNSL
ncbi:Uncharacterised protein [Klebsiella pneumoniae]|nr:Uncharacterised protein [Klebsiella pneumoniae]SVR73141.1 Uncharacterised protein [Klebsiella pneumoniae]SWG24584.1 Uncharacterised protein [Klebsiella pneumoniae]SWQ08126.1 Uncharacterised protein [Klebsiella pneumoniae]SXM04434.1 Uncharacterised protein [Klebsiella pneumoniae]